ncbi:putative cell division cycle protein 16 [Skeletonema marinoi]|uniref:Cell division cycle protein 16 n=1 Tax=Skeletonema marinoi TaxID=267567 RepID=A0AAD8YE11_9STRA|nr:putative cell division cycle protein 16 [Skeletonema marinoi]
MTASLSNYLIQIGQDNETIQLRSFVQSLLGMHLPASSPLNNNNQQCMRMTTPDPTTAAFYAQALYAKTNGRRPDDAYLAARAMSLKGEGKRAIWILDKSGLIGFGVGSGGDHGDGGGGGVHNDNAGLDQSVQQQQHSNDDDAQYYSIHNISNKEGIRNALLLRTEAALWQDNVLFRRKYNNRDRGDEEEDELDSKLADEMYIRQWREQSLSHMALIDDGDDERLFRLADNIQSVQFSSLQLMMEGIHPMSRLCAARGVAYDEISNSHRAIPFLRMALTIDARCIEALDYVVKRRLLDPEEERRWGCVFGSFAGRFGCNDFASNIGDGDDHPNFVSVTGRKPSIDHSFSQTVDEAFRNLATKHHLGKSSDILSHAAIRAYGSHDLRSALAYCTAIDAYDPFCRTAGYVHVATLVGLGLKRRLFELAHRLVDADPRIHLPGLLLGVTTTSVVVCDESDQALASFRAAQNKYAGSHVPLLYMGMEYLRTNHLSLAGHFLTSAQKTDASDPLCCNELGVWSYRRGDMEDAAFAESSALTSTDEALGMEGYILLSSEGRGKKQQVAQESLDPVSPHVKRRSDSNVQPPSTVLCAVKTPSGRSISASIVGATIDNTLADTECIERCNDKFWEPTIFNLGQSYRKMRCYSEAIVCFEKSVSLNPGSYSAYAAMGFAKHLSGDVDGAIDSYHEALSRKPEDPFSSEMLTRALSEAVTYPRSSVLLQLTTLMLTWICRPKEEELAVRFLMGWRKLTKATPWLRTST